MLPDVTFPENELYDNKIKLGIETRKHLNKIKPEERIMQLLGKRKFIKN